MGLHLDWDISSDDWRQYSQHVRRFPLLQSLEYGRAVEEFYGHTSRYAFLLGDEGTVVGLCRVQDVGIFKNLLHAVMCDRGPIWLDGHDLDKNFEYFVRELAKTFPRRIGRRRRFIPEQTNQSDTLEKHGWRKVGDGYDTIWIDLTQDKQTFRSDLKKNWRGSLKKLEATDVTVEWDETGQSLPWLLKRYEIDKAQRRYDGASPKFLRVLGRIFADNQHILIGRSIKEERCVSSILILCHGTSATYQVGWTSDEGRKICTHHGLLWQAMLTLKSRGIKDFDLGGLNDKSASGVGKFKRGMGGEIVTLPGVYI